jgi:lipopolysaccharide biosynthesis regulator YciM
VPARLGLLLALLFGALVAYLTALNPSRVRIVVGPDWAYDVPLLALVVGVFLAGACVALVITLLRDLGQSLRDFQRARGARRAQSLSEVYHRGVDAQLAGRSTAAAEAYEEVLAREPGSADPHLRLGELAQGRGDWQAALEHRLHALRADERPDTLLAVALDYQRLGRPEEALATYRRILERDRSHLTALRAIRDLTVRQGRWSEALGAQERLLHALPDAGRGPEQEWLAGIHYELGKELSGEGKIQEALGHFREALKADRGFLPAPVAIGDAYLRAGDSREALRAWERAAEAAPAPVLLHRIEQVYRAEGRPSRMITLYQDAVGRAPQDLALAFQLGRVYFELEMLDEAADQFQKVEVRAPDLAPLHAYLGAIFERRGQGTEAFAEYRRALALSGGFESPYRCTACGAPHARWQDRCPACSRWNTGHP